MCVRYNICIRIYTCRERDIDIYIYIYMIHIYIYTHTYIYIYIYACDTCVSVDITPSTLRILSSLAKLWAGNRSLSLVAAVTRLMYVYIYIYIYIYGHPHAHAYRQLPYSCLGFSGFDSGPNLDCKGCRPLR